MDFQILGFLGILTGVFTFLFIVVAIGVYAYRNRDKPGGQFAACFLIWLLIEFAVNFKF